MLNADINIGIQHRVCFPLAGLAFIQLFQTGDIYCWHLSVNKYKLCGGGGSNVAALCMIFIQSLQAFPGLTNDMGYELIRVSFLIPKDQDLSRLLAQYQDLYSQQHLNCKEIYWNCYSCAPWGAALSLPWNFGGA